MMHICMPQDTPCVLLHKVPGGELKDVSTAKLIQPANHTMHCKPMDDVVMRVELGRVLGGAKTWTLPCNLREPTST
jgi:hypothetical protein